MNRLEALNRPLVVFDPANLLHREYFFQFVQTGSLGRAPVRFTIGDDRGDLITMIQRKLVQYYLEQELGNKST
jgi:hypothetical protein